MANIKDKKQQDPEFKGKRNSKRRNYKGKFSDDRGNDKLGIYDGSNDAHWYGSDEVLKLAGNLSFFTALGMPVVEHIINSSTTAYTGLDVVPGVMAIHLMDALPISSNANWVANPSINPINIAARQQYALIRKANSGAKNYEWTDLIIYEMARSSINEVFAFIARAYGVANCYNMQNRYMPKRLLEMMGFNADDFISNLATIRLWLNNFAKRANTLALPHSLSYFERKAWLYSNIYTDSSTAKAQIYFFTPGATDAGGVATIGAFYVYSDNLGSAGAGGLYRSSLFSAGATFNSWSAVADGWLNLLLSDDDCAIISGDILKAYGDGNLFKCNPIPEDFTVTPIFNEEVLSQIENLTCAPDVQPTAMTQDTGDDILLHKGYIIQSGAGGDLLFNPFFNTGSSTNSLAATVCSHPLINFHHTDVNPSEVMVGTRLTTLFSLPRTSGTGSSVLYGNEVAACGTEIVTNLEIAVAPSGNSNKLATKTYYAVTTSNNMQAFNAMLRMVHFDWAPKLYINVTSGGYGLYLPFGELSTYRVLSDTELGKLHDTATIYMFGVPLIQSY